MDNIPILPGFDFWIELPEPLKRLINEAKAQLDKGEGIPHDEVMAAVRERFLSNNNY